MIYNVNPKSTEPNHESLAIRINRKLKAIDVIDTLASLFILRDHHRKLVTPLQHCAATRLTSI